MTETLAIPGLDRFVRRHIGPRPDDVDAMLRTLGYDSLDDMITATVPESIRLDRQLDLPAAESEHDAIRALHTIASKNAVFRSHLGMGYADCIVPGVIQRNVLENPGWYTAYTPYQAEISQGRLEALLNYQTMICDLTGFDIANASLLDEATAAAEAPWARPVSSSSGVTWWVPSSSTRRPTDASMTSGPCASGPTPNSRS